MLEKLCGMLVAGTQGQKPPWVEVSQLAELLLKRDHRRQRNQLQFFTKLISMSPGRPPKLGSGAPGMARVQVC